MSDPIRVIGGPCHRYQVRLRNPKPVIELRRQNKDHLYRLMRITAAGEDGNVEFLLYVPHDWTDGQAVEFLISTTFAP